MIWLYVLCLLCLWGIIGVFIFAGTEVPEMPQDRLTKVILCGPIMWMLWPITKK